jgi:alkyl sulfatase BDS1-like metallo-beta-lactamase superfamily hydrolase
VFAQHHWPVWGQARLSDYLRRQRDTYKFMHDQTLRLMNHGLKPAEIAERLRLPQALERNWSSRGYYGTLSHNAKAIYQRYIGWYDGNPANLQPLPPVERAVKMVEYMGGAAAALTKARADFARGEYRWVAEIANAIVFSDPKNADARALCADAFEQLGYQAESATWRNAYLLGAQELRHGSPPMFRPPVRPDMLAAIAPAQLFDYLAIRVDPLRAEGLQVVLNWTLTDTGEFGTTTLEHAALTTLMNTHSTVPDVVLSLPRAGLNALVMRTRPLSDMLTAGEAALTGAAGKLAALFGVLDEFPLGFAIVEPNGN